MNFDRNLKIRNRHSEPSDERRCLTYAPLTHQLALSICAPSSNGPYATSEIQKGPVLLHGSADLSGEGVGLGVPVAKSAHRVFFPRKARLTERKEDPYRCVWIADYALNLEERLVLNGSKSIQSESFYALKELFAQIHKTVGAARNLFEYASSALRRVRGLARRSKRHVQQELYVCINTVDVRENLLREALTQALFVKLNARS